jgi:hypothetical protein
VDLSVQPATLPGSSAVLLVCLRLRQSVDGALALTTAVENGEAAVNDHHLRESRNSRRVADLRVHGRADPSPGRPARLAE